MKTTMIITYTLFINLKKSTIMKTIIRKNTWLQRHNGLDFGWGNGYVIIPEGHPLWGKTYFEIEDLMPELDVHGGLTFSQFANKLNWKELKDKDKTGEVVGFDTSHFGDNLKNWPRKRILAETIKLKEQLENYKKS